MRSLALSVVVLACCSSPDHGQADARLADTGGADTRSADATPTDAPAAAPPTWGLFILGSYPQEPQLPYTGSNTGAPPNFAPATRIAISQDLHAGAQRTEVRFGGSGQITGTAFAQDIGSAGLALALTVLSQPDGSDGAVPPLGSAGVAAYEASLGSAIDLLHPAVVMVENEEISGKFFEGSASDYAPELAAAVETAHGRGVAATNGGLTGLPCRLLTWYAYDQAGDFTHADAFGTAALTAFPAIHYAQFPTAANPTAPIPAAAMTIITNALAYVDVYAHSDIDYLNVHLYQLDAEPFAEVVAYLTGAVGKPLMTGEMGQYDEDPATVTAMLGAADAAHFVYVIWFSGDGDPAVGLVDEPTTTTYDVRDLGSAYRSYAQAH